MPMAEVDPRVALASERTLLAWMRTALALIGFGFVVARFGLFLRELAMMGHTVASPPPSSQLVESELADSPAVEALSGGTSGSLWIGVGLILIGAAVAVLAASQHVRFIHGLLKDEPYRPKRLSLGVLLALGLTVIGGLMAGYLLLSV